MELVYLALPSIEMSRLRVAERVAHGGHDIPVNDIIRRFPRSLQNLLEEYSVLAHRTRCFMNSGDIPELIFEQHGANRVILHDDFYQLILKKAGQ